MNRRQHHRPLRRGEIACYASHIAAWRSLVESGEPAMAIFEDDIEVDDDLPGVLDAVARGPVGWGLVKLIGRSREKIRAESRFVGGRRLIAYRRVPSLTAAYVVSAACAAGAAKLLARRQPFGRPVDVDLRYWWECDLRVLASTRIRCAARRRAASRASASAAPCGVRASA